MVGHLGTKYLSAAALAFVFMDLTSTFLWSTCDSMKTLCSQAFGARNFKLGMCVCVCACLCRSCINCQIMNCSCVCVCVHAVGIWMQLCCAVVTVLCVIIGILWWFVTGPVLRLVGVNRSTALLAQVCVCVCACICLFCERVRGRERERYICVHAHTHTHTYLYTHTIHTHSYVSREKERRQRYSTYSHTNIYAHTRTHTRTHRRLPAILSYLCIPLFYSIA